MPYITLKGCLKASLALNGLEYLSLNTSGEVQILLHFKKLMRALQFEKMLQSGHVAAIFPFVCLGEVSIESNYVVHYCLQIYGEQ